MYQFDYFRKTFGKKTYLVHVLCETIYYFVIHTDAFDIILLTEIWPLIVIQICLRKLYRFFPYW